MRNHFVFVLLLMTALVCLPAAAQVKPNPDVEEPVPNELPGGFTDVVSPNESADATLEFAAEANLINLYIRDYAPQPVPWCPNCCTDCCEPLPGGIDHAA